MVQKPYLENPRIEVRQVIVLLDGLPLLLGLDALYRMRYALPSMVHVFHPGWVAPLDLEREGCHVTNSVDPGDTRLEEAIDLQS